MPPDLLPTEPFARDSVAEARADKPFSLLVVRDGEASTYPLGTSGRLLIGRSADAELRIDHASVSREHAALHLGESLSIEDLGSANGTRVRDLPLRPGAAVEIFPDDVIDLGAVLLVVQYRRIEQRLRRSCDRPFFEVRLEEERERALAGGSPFALAQLEVEGGLGSHAVQLLLAAELHDEDLVSSSAPGKYDLLWLAINPADAAKRLDGIVARFAQRNLRARGQLDCYPRAAGAAAASSEHAPRSASAWRTRQNEIVVVDPAMQRVYKLLQRVADSDSSVLFMGESGAGKSLCAEYLHGASARSGRPLVSLHCAALSEASLDSQLFGEPQAEGDDKPGLLESTQGGTLLLRCVSDMPLATQIKLLRALSTREVVRPGTRTVHSIDVRILATTRVDLQERITAGLFREDLFYRLSGCSVIVPPLRERVDDIAPLARYFLSQYSRPGCATPVLSEASIDLLESQGWPGNVRDVRRCLERAAANHDASTLEPMHLGLELPRQEHGWGRRQRPHDLRNEVRTLERERIERALADCQGNQRRAAEALGLSRGALLRRLELLGLPRPRKGG